MNLCPRCLILAIILQEKIPIGLPFDLPAEARPPLFNESFMNVYEYCSGSPMCHLDPTGYDDDNAGWADGPTPSGENLTVTAQVDRDPVIESYTPMDRNDSNSVGNVNLSEMVVSEVDAAEGRGQIGGQDVKHFGKGVADSVLRGIANLIGGPIYGPLTGLLLPQSKVDPKYGGGELIGRAVGIGIIMGAEGAALGLASGVARSARVSDEAAGEARAITSTPTRSPITSTLTRSPITSTSPKSTVVASEYPNPPTVDELVPSLRPDRPLGSTPHPFEEAGKGLHPQIFDIHADLQAARSGDAAAAARIGGPKSASHDG
jgi:hypothetical protein